MGCPGNKKIEFFKQSRRLKRRTLRVVCAWKLSRKESGGSHKALSHFSARNTREEETG